MPARCRERTERELERQRQRREQIVAERREQAAERAELEKARRVLPAGSSALAPSPTAGDTAWAMSEENVEMVRQGYEAFSRGDIEAAVTDFAPDFECDMSRAVGFNVDRDIYDLDQFRRLFDEYVDSWEDFRLGADEFIDAADDVVVPFTNRVRGRDGIELQGRGTFVWTIRDGAVVRACLYQELAEALKAVGLSE